MLSRKNNVVYSLEGILSPKRARKNNVVQSSAEVEYRSMIIVTCELLRIKQLF